MIVHLIANILLFGPHSLHLREELFQLPKEERCAAAVERVDGLFFEGVLSVCNATPDQQRLPASVTSTFPDENVTLVFKVDSVGLIDTLVFPYECRLAEEFPGFLFFSEDGRTVGSIGPSGDDRVLLVFDYSYDCGRSVFMALAE